MFPVSMHAKNKMAENLDPLLESQSVAPSSVPAAARILHSDFCTPQLLVLFWGHFDLHNNKSLLKYFRPQNVCVEGGGWSVQKAGFSVCECVTHFCRCVAVQCCLFSPAVLLSSLASIWRILSKRHSYCDITIQSSAVILGLGQGVVPVATKADASVKILSFVEDFFL